MYQQIEIFPNPRRLPAVVGFVGEGAGWGQAVVPHLLDVLSGLASPRGGCAGEV